MFSWNTGACLSFVVNIMGADGLVMQAAMAWWNQNIPAHLLLLMLWIFASPGHRPPWYWLCRTIFHGYLMQNTCIHVCLLCVIYMFYCINILHSCSKLESSHLINYPFIMTQVACVLKINHCFWIMACSPCGTKPLCKTGANDDVIKWKHSLRCWPFVRGIHRSPVNSPHGTSDAELWCFFWSVPEKKLLSIQSSSWWFETPLHPLWRHWNVIYHQYLNFSLHMQSPWLLESKEMS